MSGRSAADVAGAMLLAKLHVLKYPRVSTFSMTDGGEVAQLVVFLEDRCVRAWEIDARAPLRVVNDGWPTAFAAYLSDIGCPYVSSSHPFQPDHIPDYVRWLVSRAVDDVFQDKAASVNPAAAAELAAHGVTRGATAAPSVAPTPSGREPVPPPVAAEVAALCRDLAALCHVTPEGRSEVEIVQACHRVLRQRVMPALAAVQAAPTTTALVDTSGASGEVAATAPATGARRRGGSVKPSTGLTTAELMDLSTFPLGFSTGDEVVDKAAAILRMLYVTDLRELQDAINDILVTVQEFTAAPKTDSSLGLVGR